MTTILKFSGSPAITISSGATYTTSSLVTLSPSADSADYMYITNILGCGSGGVWEAYMVTKTGWILSQTNTTATVYIRFKDNAGNLSSCVSDTIIHDNIAPTAPTNFDNGIQSEDLWTSPSVTWSAGNDIGSGLSHYEVALGTAQSGTSIVDWTNIGNVNIYSFTNLNLTASNRYYISIKTSDNAGNLSQITSGDNFIAKQRGSINIAADYSYQCSILNNNQIKCWGYNSFGQLGQGHSNYIGDTANEMKNNLNHINLGTGRTALELTTGTYHTCTRLDNNQIKCWGKNDNGQLGQGHTNNIGDGPNEMGNNLATIDLGTGRTALEISAGGTHTCVRLDNNQIKCWGNNDNGQLGQGHTNNIGDGPNEMGDNLPAVNLGTGRTALEISAGGSYTCARLDNNQVKCWGNNSSAQLGQGHTNNIGYSSSQMGDNLPIIDLGTGRTTLEISAGNTHTCARLDNNQVKCWGSNGFSRLGQGHSNTIGDGSNEMGDNLPAVNLGTGRTAIAISSGFLATCVILDNQSVKCWGANDGGDLGIGKLFYAGEMGDDLPVVNLGAGRTALEISAGWGNACALLDNQFVKCWGQGYFGRGINNPLGDEASDMGDNLPYIDL